MDAPLAQALVVEVQPLNICQTITPTVDYSDPELI